jgi:hypothetical protein
MFGKRYISSASNDAFLKTQTQRDNEYDELIHHPHHVPVLIQII